MQLHNEEPQADKLFEKMVALFPDGPPSEEIRDAILRDEIASSNDVLASITKLDNERALHVEMPAGTRIDAQKQGQHVWRFEISSPPAPSGEQVALRFTIKGSGKYESSRVDMQLAMAVVSGDMLAIKRKLLELISKYGDGTKDGGRYDEMPAAFRPAYETMTTPTALFLDALYKTTNNAAKTDEVLDVSYLDVDLQTPLLDAITNTMAERQIKAVLACIAIAEISWEKYQIQLTNYEKFMEEVMAKNTGGSRWYLISGNRKNIKKIANSFTHSNIFHVSANEEWLYVWIQEREWKFLSGIVKSNSCRVAECKAPEYGVTKCGKNHTAPNIHSRRCNACKRAQANEARAKESEVATAKATESGEKVSTKEPATPNTHSPDKKFTSGVGSTHPSNPLVPPPNSKRAEEKEWVAKNGPVITVQGPKNTPGDDYATLAAENRRVADELMERATYYEKLADHYEALLQPTPAVQEAETAMEEAVRKAQEILDAARAKAQADRDEQKEALNALIADGPPV